VALQETTNVNTLPKHYPRVSTQPRQRRITRVVEIGCTNWGRVTIEGFRQVFGCAPTHLLETYEDGKCVAVECTGLVDG
jgi:hypothetical protein